MAAALRDRRASPAERRHGPGAGRGGLRPAGRPARRGSRARPQGPADLTGALEQLPDPVWRSAARCGRGDRVPGGLRRRSAPRPRRGPAWSHGSASTLAVVVGSSHPAARPGAAGSVARALRSVPGAGAKLRYVARRLVPTPSSCGGPARWPAGSGRLALAYVLRPGGCCDPPPGRRSRLRLPGPGSPPAAASAWPLVTAPRCLVGVARVEHVRRTWRIGPSASPPPPAPRGGPQSRGRFRQCCGAEGQAAWRSPRPPAVARTPAGPVDLVVGVTAPGTGFRAHAWLADDQDAEHNHATMTVILRRPTPQAWLS